MSTTPSKSTRSPRLPLLSLPNPTPSPASPRTRSASLSIARSPLLAPSTSISGIIPGMHLRGLSYTSIPLGKISDDEQEQGHGYAYELEDRGSESIGLGHRRKSPRSPDIPRHLGSDNVGEREGRRRHSGDDSDDARQSAELAELERDIEAFDIDTTGPEPGLDEYSGPFQPPKGIEALGIAVSVSAVALLAVVACFTTVYDWVL